MTDHKDSDMNEIIVGAKGVTLKGDVAGDLRAPIKRAAGTADSVLRLLDNVVGLPGDFINVHLERFRDKYKEQLGKIPPEKRQQPSLRTGCSVIRHVAYSAEEPEIQDLFARLLATASNNEKSNMAHPGFASVINDLTPEEARLLLAFSKRERPIQMLIDELNILGEEAGINDLEEINRGTSNLLRLGLVEWVVFSKKLPNKSLEKIVGKKMYHAPYSQDDINRTTIEVINDLQNMKNSVISALQQQEVVKELRLASFGKQFLEACVLEN